MSPEELLADTFSDDELARENRRRQGLEEPMKFPYRGDSKMTDMFGNMYPPIGMGSKQFLSEKVSHPDTGRVGYSQTTRWGSGTGMKRADHALPTRPAASHTTKLIRSLGCRTTR
jgi:hypothetical protein